MTRYLLDTNTVSHLFKRHTSVAARVQAVPIASLCISAVTQGEIYFGLAKRPDARSLHDAAAQFFQRVDVLAWDSTVAKEYGAMRAELQRHGRSLAPLDLLIAAHAKAATAVLVTSDRAFGQVPKLQMQDWTQ